MEAEPVEIPVPVTVKVPEELTVPCGIEPRIATTYGDDVDVALEALAALTACNVRMKKIRELE